MSIPPKNISFIPQQKQLNLQSVRLNKAFNVPSSSLEQENNNVLESISSIKSNKAPIPLSKSDLLGHSNYSKQGGLTITKFNKFESPTNTAEFWNSSAKNWIK